MTPRIKYFEEEARKLGFELCNAENYIHGDFGDVLTLKSKDVEIFVGTLQELERWLQGFFFARNKLLYIDLGYGFVKPSKREWVGLTDDEVFKILDDVLGFNTCFGLETPFVCAFARAIEAKLKEKNA